VQEKRLDAALEELLKLEKEARSTADAPRIQRVVVAIVQLCYEARAWKTLIKQILFLSQRPNQLKQVSFRFLFHNDRWLMLFPSRYFGIASNDHL
jgi:hypothetical protein